MRNDDGKHHLSVDIARQPDHPSRRRNASALAIALGVGAIALAIVQAFFGVAVSATGRWGWLNVWMIQLLGQHGPAIFSGVAGILLLAIGIRGRNSIRSY